MKSSRVSYLVYIVCVSLISIFLLMTASIGTLIFMGNGRIPEIQVSSYPYLQLNIRSNESSEGIMSMSDHKMKQDLEEYGYLYFRDEGNNFLISTFGSDEYQCSGTCYCDNSERRNYGQTISRGVFFLIAAITSLVAYEKAKEYFEEECVKEMSSECPRSNINSEVDECSKIKDVEKRLATPRDKGRDMRMFYCRGNCIDKNIRSDSVWLKAAKRKILCENLVREGEVQVDCSGLSGKVCHERARRGFVKEYLTQYCKKESRFDFYYNRNDGHGQWEDRAVCVSALLRNHSIRCKQCYPRYRKHADWRNWIYVRKREE